MITTKKIAYLGNIPLTDTDFSYLNEAQNMADITYYVEVNPRYMNGPALSFKQLYPKSGIFKARDIYREFEKYEGFIDLDKAYVVNATGRLWALKSLWLHFLLLIQMIFCRYDVIHIAWPLNIYQFALYFLRKKMLLTVHDPFPHSFSNSLIVRIRRSVAFSLTRNFVILNQEQKEDFVKYYHLKGKNVIDSRLSNCTFLQCIDNVTKQKDNQYEYILAFGRICRYKGFDYLLPAMKKVHEAHPECKLVIAGKGDFHFDISEYSSLDYVDLRNRFIPDDEMVSLVKNALFMVCPYTDATQSGVIMSSYAFYRPVVATNVGGLPEMVIDGKYGLIVKEKDVAALADAIIKLLDNRAMLDTFSKKIEEDYTTGERSWRETAKKLVEEYDKLI